MRILMVSQFYWPVAGGQERYVQTLSAALAARGHEIEIATIATSPDLPREEVQRVDGSALRVRRMRTTMQGLGKFYSDPERPHAPPFPDPAFARRVGEELATQHFDVVHAHDWSVVSVLGPAHRAGLPVVLTLHDYSHVCANKRLVRAGGPCSGPSPLRCARCAAGQYGVLGPVIFAANHGAAAYRRRRVAEFIAVSNAVAAASGLPRSGVPFTVIPNLIPDALVADGPPPRADGSGGPILYVGDVTLDKGFEVLVDAYRRLDSPPDLVLAGRVLVDAGDPPAGVRLLGVVDPEKVRSLMSSARMVVVPSICPDACPTVVLEAMAAGRPVVASATGGIVDLVTDGRTGKLVRAGDPASLADAIAALLADRDAAAALGRAAYDRVWRYSGSAVAAAVEDVYTRVCRDDAADAVSVGRRDQS